MYFIIKIYISYKLLKKPCRYPENFATAMLQTFSIIKDSYRELFKTSINVSDSKKNDIK